VSESSSPLLSSLLSPSSSSSPFKSSSSSPLYVHIRMHVLGPQFEIPVTVVRPETIKDGSPSWCLESDSNDKVVSFKPNERIRRFIVPPKGCTYIDAVIVDSRDKVNQIL
jgi:hypothetical protein